MAAPPRGGGFVVVARSAARISVTRSVRFTPGTVDPPSGPNRKQQADYDKMAKLKGDSFDRMFAQHMVTDHKKEITAYQKASKKKDAAGQYAQESLPILQKHLETAQALSKKR